MDDLNELETEIMKQNNILQAQDENQELQDNKDALAPESTDSTQDDLASEWEKMMGATSGAREMLQDEWEEEIGDKKEEHLGAPLNQNAKLSLLLDIPLEISVEIGSTKMSIEDVLKLNPNSVVELDRLISEQVDLKVNGRLVAQGELYTVKSNFGIRITKIITPEERFKLLREV